MARIESHELNISDRAIHCGGCESRIEQVLGREPGVRRVKADRTTQRVAVTVDADQFGLDELRAKLDALGFPPA